MAYLSALKSVVAGLVFLFCATGALSQGLMDRVTGVADLVVQIRNENKKIYDLIAAENGKLRAELGVRKGETDRLQTSIQDELQKILFELQDAKRQIVSLGQSQDQLKQQLIQAAAQQANDKDQLRASIFKLDKDLQDLGKVQNELSGQFGSVVAAGKDNVAKLESDRVGMDIDLKKARTEVDDLRKLLTATEANWSKARDDLDSKLRTSVAAVDTKVGTLQARVSTAEDTVGGLRAKVEALDPYVKGVEKRLDEKVGEVSSQVDVQKKKIEPQRVSRDGLDIEAVPAEINAYDAAFAIFQRQDYEKSLAAFKQFLSSYQTPGLRASAHYYLGRSLVELNRFEEARPSLQRVVESDHPLAPDAKFQIVLCRIGLKDKRPAIREALEALIKAHPTSSAAGDARNFLPRFR